MLKLLPPLDLSSIWAEKPIHILELAQSTGTKLISACGNVNNPGVYEIELGLPVEEFLYSPEYCGGVSNGKKLKAVIPGGSSVPDSSC